MVAAVTHRAMTGVALDPDKLLPERYREAKAVAEKTPRQRKRDTRAALALFGRSLGDRNPLG